METHLHVWGLKHVHSCIGSHNEKAERDIAITEQNVNSGLLKSTNKKPSKI